MTERSNIHFFLTHVRAQKIKIGVEFIYLIVPLGYELAIRRDIELICMQA